MLVSRRTWRDQKSAFQGNPPLYVIRYSTLRSSTLLFRDFQSSQTNSIQFHPSSLHSHPHPRLHPLPTHFSLFDNAITKTIPPHLGPESCPLLLLNTPSVLHLPLEIRSDALGPHLRDFGIC